MANINEQKRLAQCEICFQHKQIPINTQIYINKHAKCPKNHPYCQDCLSKHMLYKIKETKTSDILCPGCPEPLDPVQCSAILDRSVFVEWTDLLVESFITDGMYGRATCPNEECSEVVVQECVRVGSGEEFCPRCKGQFCFSCGAKWSVNHDQVCEAYEVWFWNALEYGILGRCPKCHFFVERTFGCNRIRCRCGAVFSYGNDVERCQHIARHSNLNVSEIATFVFFSLFGLCYCVFLFYVHYSNH